MMLVYQIVASVVAPVAVVVVAVAIERHHSPKIIMCTVFHLLEKKEGLTIFLLRYFFIRVIVDLLYLVGIL